MRLYIEFDDEMEKEVIDFWKSKEGSYKYFLKDQMKHLVYEEYREEKETNALLEKQRNCNHDYQEHSRTNRNFDGEPFIDEDGEYHFIERVTYKCSKCESIENKMEYESRW